MPRRPPGRPRQPHPRRTLLHPADADESNAAGGTWRVRDAGSRNGTFLNDERLPSGGAAELADADELAVGGSRLVFTFDPSAPLAADGDDRLSGETRGPGDADPAGGAAAPGVGAKILDRRRATALAGKDGGGDRRVGSLYRLALALGSAADPTEAGRAALDVLLDHTPADIGAVLLLTGDDEPARGEEDDSDAAKSGRAVRAARRLSLVAHRARRDGPYRLVSESVSRAVLTDGAAILAEDVSDDDRLAGRDSLGKLRADSLACAPLRPNPAGGKGATRSPGWSTSIRRTPATPSTAGTWTSRWRWRTSSPSPWRTSPGGTTSPTSGTTSPRRKNASPTG